MNLFSGLKGEALKMQWKGSVPHIGSYPVEPTRAFPDEAWQELHALAQKTGLRLRLEGGNLLISGDYFQVNSHYAQFYDILAKHNLLGSLA